MWPAIAAAGISAAAGAIKNKSNTTVTTPLAYQPLEQMILNSIQKRLSGGNAAMEAYSAGGVKDINHVFDLVGQRNANDLTARGLGASPVAGMVDANAQNARASGISGFLSNLPMVQRQWQAEDLGIGSNLLGISRGTQSTSGGGVGGAMSGMGTMLGYLIANGAFDKNKTGGGGPTLPGSAVPIPSYP